jgi:hypothetical protein
MLVQITSQYCRGIDDLDITAKLSSTIYHTDASSLPLHSALECTGRRCDEQYVGKVKAMYQGLYLRVFFKISFFAREFGHPFV